jgi:plasmid stabilization system protein ParE
VTPFVLTPAAEGDIRDILEYIEHENPSASVRVADALRDAMRLVAERPSLGHARADLASEAIRFWPVFSYLVIYRPDTNPLQIVRVLHGRRDVRRLLED